VARQDRGCFPFFLSVRKTEKAARDRPPRVICLSPASCLASLWLAARRLASLTRTTDAVDLCLGANGCQVRESP
jgi:hypothetical protein